MKRPLRGIQTLACAAAVTLTMVACGGGGDTDGADAGAATPQTPAAAQGDGELVLGTLLPQTGNLAFLGPPQIAGVKAAVAEINAAGGVNGRPVVQRDADSGDTSTDIASQSVDRLLSEKSDVIIGAASSGVSMTVIDKVTGAGVVQLSPANTSPDFSRYEDNGLYFRTAPSDVLQGRVMGNLVVQDGHSNVGVLALDDPYGKGLAANVEKSVEDGGGALSTDPIIYDPKAASFSAEVTQLKSSNPDAVVLIGFDETKKIVPELAAQGIGPDAVPLYFVDGNLNDYSSDFPAGLLEGVKGTQPGAEIRDDLRGKLMEADPSLTVFNYGPEAYDAAVITALAAQAAADDSGASIASELRNVTTGGEKCTDFAGCLALLNEDKDIDYDGVSGPIEFDEWGDPTEATIGVYRYGSDNNYTSLEYVSGKL